MKKDDVSLHRVAQNTRVEVTTQLPQDAMRRLRTARIKARKNLESHVVEFLEQMKRDGVRELGRNPNSEDLVPYFSVYAGAMLRTEMLEWETIARPNDLDRLLRAAMASILDEICGHEGLWHKVVTLACEAVNLGSWKTKFGWYECKVLMSPRRLELRARLNIAAKGVVVDLRQLAMASSSASGVESAIPPDGDAFSSHSTSSVAKSEFPDRAVWLTKQMDHRGWGPQQLHDAGGPDPKTIRRILAGKRVHATTRGAVAKALSTVFSSVDGADMPNS